MDTEEGRVALDGEGGEGFAGGGAVGEVGEDLDGEIFLEFLDDGGVAQGGSVHELAGLAPVGPASRRRS